MMPRADNAPLLSIVIVNWNTKDFLLECVRSIYRSLPVLPFELIVVDNASSDGSAAAVRGEFPRAQVIENPSNEGFAKANNQGYARAKADAVVFLNPDTLVYPEAFAVMRSYLLGHDEVGAVSCLFESENGALQREFYRRFPNVAIVFFWFTPLGKVIDLLFRGQRTKKFYFYDEKKFCFTENIDQPGATCLMVKREVAARVGLFDEEFPIFFNDVDLCRRIKNAGFQIHVVAPATIRHYGGTSVGKLPRRLYQHYFWNGVAAYFRKHHGKASVMAVRAIMAVNYFFEIAGVNALLRLILRYAGSLRVNGVRGTHAKIIREMRRFGGLVRKK
ncbi:MAG: glycosyltransferase family 2 protein [Candidatus Omnitrophica bacterium]|nr:glycosyltransferase family 2 protein [Candidatus Omnitrophota bacterium]